MRCTCVYPGVVASERAETGRAIHHAIEQPADGDVNEIVVRPLATQVGRPGSTRHLLLFQ